MSQFLWVENVSIVYLDPLTVPLIREIEPFAKAEITLLKVNLLPCSLKWLLTEFSLLWAIVRKAMKMKVIIYEIIIVSGNVKAHT